jgi:O-glycosyl hydrolase
MFSKIRSSIFALTAFLTLLIPVNILGETSTVNWTDVHQQMDGWGGEDWFGNSSVGPGNGSSGFALTSGEAAQFFSPTSGIGLEFIRTGNYYCPTTGACAVSTANVPDLQTLQYAVADGAKVTVHIQPPANLQYGGNFTAGTPDPSTGLCIDSNNWSAFAAFTVQWIQMLQANGVPVYDLEVANEGNLNQTDTLGGCMWTPAGLDSYISGHLGPAFSSAGLTTKIAMSQNYDWFTQDFVSTCLDDPACAQYVGIVNAHDYGTGSQDGMGTGYCCITASAPPSSVTTQHVWMSETNGGFTYNSSTGNWSWDTSMADALVWARSIHDYLTIANASAWFYWELVDYCGGVYTYGCATAPFNNGLAISTGGGQTPASLTVGKRYYTIGNWSKFVRNGYYRIDSTKNPQAGVYVTAFQSASSGTLVIVAVNTNGSNTSQSFAVTNAPTFSTVDPYVTSASLSLSAQAAVSLSGNEFTYTLPSESVTTFLGSSSMQPPTELTAKAH